jgi:hypothetical protein
VELSHQIVCSLLEDGYARRLVAKSLLRAQIKKTLKSRLEALGYTGLIVQTWHERFISPAWTEYSVTIYLQPPDWIKDVQGWEVRHQMNTDVHDALNHLQKLNFGLEDGGIVINRNTKGQYWVSAHVRRNREIDPADPRDWPLDDEVPF